MNGWRKKNVPLKPIFGKTPLTELNSLPLRAGQIRMNNEAVKTVYDLVKNDLPAHPERWEAAVRLSAVLNGDAEAASACISDALKSQQEDGSFRERSLEDSLQIARAVWALYEIKPDKAVLIQLMNWCAYLAANWDAFMASRAIRVAGGDLMALLCDLYRVTGKKAVLNLCEKLRQEGMDWSGVLHTFSVQRPMKRIIDRVDLETGMMAEEGNADGFYTRQYLTCHGETLADGARASLMSAVYSGNGRESTAARTGWEKIARWHGAVCGGVTADDTLAGGSPSAAVATAAAGAWAETFAAQIVGKESAWACDALETLLCNAMPAAIAEGGVMAYQRVNSIEADCGTMACYFAKNDAAAALTRLARGYAATASAAVTARPDGAQVNLYMPGQYTMKVNGASFRLTMEGENGAYKLQVAASGSVKAALRLFVPGWAEDAFIQVNAEGGHEGHAGSYFTLEREWKNGDMITVEFARKLRVVEGYHQSAAVMYGAQVMAFVPADTWSVALCGEPSVKEGKVVASFAPVADWKQAGGVPVDLPVRPEQAGEVFEAEMVPYAQTKCRVAQFPRCKA